jgi:hypothetical protein
MFAYAGVFVFACVRVLRIRRHLISRVARHSLTDSPLLNLHSALWDCDSDDSGQPTNIPVHRVRPIVI